MKITFFRTVINPKGESYKSPLMTITIPNSIPEHDALDEAIKQFQTQMKVSHWQEIAEFYEIA